MNDGQQPLDAARGMGRWGLAAFFLWRSEALRYEPELAMFVVRDPVSPLSDVLVALRRLR